MIHGHRNILLIELIIVILFFSLSASVTLQVFAIAHQRGHQSALTTEALVIAEDWSERLYGVDDPEQYLKDNGWEAGADGEYVIAPKSSILLKMTVTPEISDAGTLYRMRIAALNGANDEELFVLSVNSYISGAVEGV